MENLLNYVIDEALVVIPVLWIIGQFIKQTPNVKNWLIPYILLVIGTGLTVGIMGLSIDAVIQGVLVSGAAVFGNELIKQATEKKGDDSK